MEEKAPEGIRLLELAEFPIGERAAFIAKAHRFEPAAAIESARGQGLPVDHVSARDLIWAIAYNVTQSCEPVSPANPEQLLVRGWRKPNNYMTYFKDPFFTLESLIKRLLKPMLGNPPATNGLIELAISVACEERDDWHCPACQPVDRNAAQRTFNELMLRDLPRVRNAVRRLANLMAMDPEDLAAICYAAAYESRWQPDATARFMGLSRISTTVAKIAVTEYAKWRRRGPRTTPRPPHRGPPVPSPVDTLAKREALAALEDCRAELPAQEQRVDRAKRLSRPRADIAAELGVTVQRVDQLSKSAKERLKSSMQRRGFRREYWENEI